MSLPEWLVPAPIEVGAAALSAVALKLRVPGDVRERMKLAGFWWMIPFGETGINGVVGIRALPGVALRDSPVVRLMRENVGTIATRPGVLVPILVFEDLRGPGDYWTEIAAWPANVWEDLGRLHAALGGAGELDAFRRVLLDAEIHRRCIDESKGIVSRFRELAAVLVGIDPGFKSSIEYRLDAIDSDNPPPPPEAGLLRQSVAMASFAVHFKNQREDEALGAAWALLQEPPDLDALSPDDLPSPWPRPNSDGGLTQLEAAKLLVRRAAQAPSHWRSDPMWPVIEAMAASGEGYDGSAHVAAAAKLAPERAFWVLASAGHFRNRSGKGLGPNAPFEAARRLCQKHWSELAGVL